MMWKELNACINAGGAIGEAAARILQAIVNHRSPTKGMFLDLRIAAAKNITDRVVVISKEIGK